LVKADLEGQQIEYERQPIQYEELKHSFD